MFEWNSAAIDASHRCALKRRVTFAAVLIYTCVFLIGLSHGNNPRSTTRPATGTLPPPTDGSATRPLTPLHLALAGIALTAVASVVLYASGYRRIRLPHTSHSHSHTHSHSHFHPTTPSHIATPTARERRGHAHTSTGAPRLKIAVKEGTSTRSPTT